MVCGNSTLKLENKPVCGAAHTKPTTKYAAKTPPECGRGVIHETKKNGVLEQPRLFWDRVLSQNTPTVPQQSLSWNTPRVFWDSTLFQNTTGVFQNT